MEKDKRKILYEDDKCVLESRENRYYFSLYDKDGKFIREVVLHVKENGKVTVGQTA